MANYTDNNIVFNNVKLQENGLAFGAGPICINGAQGVDSELGGVINAIDIDWNGAQVAGKTLNTTGEVLSLISDNNTNIENVNSSLQNHTHSEYTTKSYIHSEYATKSYVTTEIENAQISGGGSSLNVEEFNNKDLYYNLLVAPDGSKYTTIGSLADDSDDNTNWGSNLCAQVNENGNTTLYSDNITCTNFTCNNADIPHEHSNYATTGHSHDYVATAGSAQTADYAETAQYAATAGQAGGATHAVSADSAETADYAETTYHAEWADMAVKWNDSAIIHIGNQGGSLNAGDTLTLTLDDIGAASTSHEHSDYATTTSIENLQSQITQLISRIAELEELVGNDSGNTDTPTDPDLPDLTPQFYFYVGETEPTVDNYTTLCTSYSDLKYPSSVYYDVLSASGASVYILVSEGLSEDRGVKRIVDSNNASISYSSISTGINMAKVYKTVEIKGGERITITLRDIINQ